MVKPVVVDEFVETGQVRFISRNYPFLGDESVRAAEAVECAADQGAFEEYGNLVFANQSGRNQGGFADEILEGLAEGIGLDVPSFESCLKDGRFAGTVRQDKEDATALGVRGTPTVFVNGVRIAPPDLPTVRAALEQTLAALGTLQGT